MYVSTDPTDKRTEKNKNKKEEKKNDDDGYRDGKSEAKVGEEKKRYYNIEKRMKQNIYKYQKCNITFTNV